MKTEFKFSNLLGTVYRCGNIVFTPDGQSLLSPVGNRVSIFNLTKNTSYTLPFAHRRNIKHITLSPDGTLLLTVDEDGRAILTIVPRRISIYHFSFKTPATAIAFSPNGKHFAVGLGRLVQVWVTPQTPGSASGELDFAPFRLHREYAGHHDDVRMLSWSGDSRFFLSSSKDLTARVWSLDPEEGFEPAVLTGHRQQVRGAWFSSSQEIIYTVSEDGALFRWEYLSSSRLNNPIDEDVEDSADERWRVVQRDYFVQANAKLKCASYHPATNLLTVCFNTGLFSLYELPSFSQIHTLSMASSPISAVATNQSGEWLALASSKTGHLLVWEHASESNVLKQSSYLDTLTSLSYSPDSSRIVTGSDDGLIKIWDTSSGFHIATFTEHSSAVTASVYSRKGNILFTSSLDGSVRAWDMLRYRNFRTFTAPNRLSFSCLAVDPSAEVVCAAGHDSFDIYLWNVQTGALLDQLSGHEGPVSTLAFTPSGTLISGSWDRTVRSWSIFSRSQSSETFQLTSDLLCVAVRPDSGQIAASTLDGSISFWNLTTSMQESGVDARRDVSGGRASTSRRTAATTPGTKAFHTITYSADGSCLLAAGNSKYICMYSISTLTLIKKFTVSINLSIGSTMEFLNSSAILSNGLPRDMIDTDGEASDLEDRIDRSLPGAKKGRDATSRTVRPEVRVSAIEFAPTGSSFCAASTEGLLIYSLGSHAGADDFDPIELGLDVTPQHIEELLGRQEYLKALIMALRLNDRGLIRRAYEATPFRQIPLVVREIPRVYLAQLLKFLAQQFESPHYEYLLIWVSEVIAIHGAVLKQKQVQFASEMRAILKGVDGIGKAVRHVTQKNEFEIEFLCQQAEDDDVLSRDNITNVDHFMADDMKTELNGDHDEDSNAGDWIGLE